MKLVKWIWSKLIKADAIPAYRRGHAAGWIEGSEYTRRVCYRSASRWSLN